MRPIESCKGCGQLFGFLPRGYCADCLDAREEQFATVKEWLFEHRGASIAAASEATGVPDATIMSFIREGRLEFVGAGGGDGGVPLTAEDVADVIGYALDAPGHVNLDLVTMRPVAQSAQHLLARTPLRVRGD